MFMKFKVLVKNQTEEKIKKLRTDNGLEFCESDFNDFCATQVIVGHKTSVGKPQPNGVAERVNRTLLEGARCKLSNVNLWHHGDFWAEAVFTACYKVNRSPHSSIKLKILE